MQSDIQLYQYNGSPRQTWEIACRHKFQLNLPLNNDRNCRFWEVLLSGSLLFQQRIPETQFSDLDVSQDELCIPIESVDDLINKYKYFTRNEDEAREFAESASKYAWRIYKDKSYSDLNLISRLNNESYSLRNWSKAFSINKLRDICIKLEQEYSL